MGSIYLYYLRAGIVSTILELSIWGSVGYLRIITQTENPFLISGQIVEEIEEI